MANFTVEDVYEALIPYAQELLRGDLGLSDRLKVVASFAIVSRFSSILWILPKKPPHVTMTWPIVDLAVSIIGLPPDPAMEETCLDLMALSHSTGTRGIAEHGIHAGSTGRNACRDA